MVEKDYRKLPLIEVVISSLWGDKAMKTYVRKRDYKSIYTQTVFKRSTDYTLVGTPDPSWQSSDWSANYTASTKDNMKKRYYYKNRYRRWT